MLYIFSELPIQIIMYLENQPMEILITKHAEDIQLNTLDYPFYQTKLLPSLITIMNGLLKVEMEKIMLLHQIQMMVIYVKLDIQIKNMLKLRLVEYQYLMPMVAPELIMETEKTIISFAPKNKINAKNIKLKTPKWIDMEKA